MHLDHLVLRWLWGAPAIWQHVAQASVLHFIGLPSRRDAAICSPLAVSRTICDDHLASQHSVRRLIFMRRLDRNVEQTEIDLLGDGHPDMVLLRQLLLRMDHVEIDRKGL